MLHIDYTWDLDSNRILLDEELNTDKLGWRAGDMFKFVNINGRQMLVKVDQLEAFVRGYKVNTMKANKHVQRDEQATKIFDDRSLANDYKNLNSILRI